MDYVYPQTMASCSLLKQNHADFESPAKVFAKLKSKVQKELLAKETVLLCDDPLYGVRERHGAAFHTPRKKAANIPTIDELENQRFGCRRGEAQALTLSPISSPRKPGDCSRTQLKEACPAADGRRGRAFMQSTSVSQPLCPDIRHQSSKGTPRIGDTVSIRTPVKTWPGESCGRSAFDKEYAPFISASPMKNRLMRTNLEPRGTNAISRPTEDTRNPPIEDYIQGLGTGRGFSADQSEMSQDETILPQSRFALDKRCSVTLERLNIMSPAKMFESMKERENRKDNGSRRGLFEVFAGSLHKSRDSPVPAPHSVAESEETTLRSSLETMVSVSRDREYSADGQPGADDPEGAPIPAAQSETSQDETILPQPRFVLDQREQPRPVLLEDPLVLNSPQLSIPKKDKEVFKRNHWPPQKKFPVDSVIYLKRWFLRRNHKGLFVDGIHGEDNIPWNSNIIVERVSSSVLKTVSGRVYILVGKMKMNLASDFPTRFLKKFMCGFPPNWSALYEKFLQESKDTDAKKNKKERPGAASINQSLRRQTQKSPKTPASCPPASSSSFSTQVTRSGRVIKPPLEYWKGGRVTVDAHMNVTIHEAYDHSISEVSTISPPSSSRKPVRVLLPISEDDPDEEASVPVRKLKALRYRNAAEKPPNLSASTSEVFKVPEQCSGRTTSSSWRRQHPAMEKRANAIPEKLGESERLSTLRSLNQRNNTYKPVTRNYRRILTSFESSPVSDEKSNVLSSDDEFATKRKKKQKQTDSRKGEMVSNKPQPGRKPSSSQPSGSFQESGKYPRRGGARTNEHHGAETKRVERRCTRASPPGTTQLGKKCHARKGAAVIPQDDGEDEWTEAELMKLQEAVSYYPKHIAGYWAKVANMVGTRSAEECHKQHTWQGASLSPKRAEKHAKKKVEPPKAPAAERPVISARSGTLKRKQQVRQFLEALPRADMDDAFSSAYMQNKRFEMPDMCPSEERDFELSELEPQTPMSSRFPEVKTPQCLHITPGMMGSPNANNDDKYIYQLQKRMKKNQFNVCKTSRSSKRFTPTPSVRRTVRRCGDTENDTFFVWEMFPENDGELSDSREEQDFYFSDD